VRAVRLILALSASRWLPRKVRWLVLRACGLKVPWNVADCCYFSGRGVEIGRGTIVNRACTFDGEVRIGRRCAIGLEVMFITSTHEPGDHSRRAGALRFDPIAVGDGCWVGSRATILPGVTIGDGAVVAAGALVRRDCEPDTLYAGVPAREVCRLDGEAEDVAAAVGRFERAGDAPVVARGPGPS
jgi:maltose O-acetyltransferase